MAGTRNHRVAIVGGMRTPFTKAGTVFKRYSAFELGVHAAEGLLQRTGIDPENVEHLVYGTVLLDPLLPNLAREIVFRTSLPGTVHAFTTSNNCITSIQSITAIADAIRDGRIETGIAGGAESLSNPPVMWGKKYARAVLDAARASSFTEKLSALSHLGPGVLKPVVPGIKEPSTGLSMGEHAELMVKEWKIPREEQDQIAYRSHMRAHAATEDGRLKAEIMPLDGVDHDLLIRSDTSLEKLAKLPPVFDRTQTGTISAGSSSPLTDGASAVLLMSEERAAGEGREALAFIHSFEYAAIDPKDGLLMAPAVAVPRLLARTGLNLSQMEIVEMHEAFGGQVACNLRAWEQGWKEPAIGGVDPEILNPLGSSIACGHPFGATGGRIVTTLANEMVRRNARYGLVSICAAGAMAAAMILER